MRRLGGSHFDPQGERTLLGTRIPLVSLRLTLAVAHYLNFRHAAKALGVSQSSVSARVKALEEDLGIPLFERHARGVRLTEAGRYFIDEVAAGIDQLDQAVKTAGMLARGEQGSLRIGVYALVPGGFLDRLLERFRSQHGLIALHITEGTACETQMQVRDGRLDIAFMASTHEIPDLHSRVLWSDRLMVALPAQHPLAQEPEIEWRHLAKETFLVRHNGTGPQVNDLIVLRSAGRWPVPPIRRFDVGRDSLVSMVARNLGIALTVEENAVHCSHVAFRPILDEPKPVAFSAVWSPHNRSTALQNLLALASGMGGSLSG